MWAARQPTRYEVTLVMRRPSRYSYVAAMRRYSVHLFLACASGLLVVHSGAQTPAASGTDPGTAVQSQPVAVDPDRNADGTYKVGPDMKAPRLIHHESLKYTKSARQKGLNGSVIVALIVDEKGLPQNVHVEQGTNTELDEIAVTNVRTYKFKPALKAGIPVPIDLSVTVNFLP